MDMQLYVNPKYSDFERQLIKVPQGNVRYEQVYEDGRNFVARVSTGGKSFVVKQYREVPFWKRMLYSSLLKSKAQQAYEKANYLLEPPISFPNICRTFLADGCGISSRLDASTRRY